VRPTRFLAETLAGLRRPPRVLVNASAVGIYGNRRGAPDRGEPPGGGILRRVCRDWEAAAAPAAAAGVRWCACAAAWCSPGKGARWGACWPRWGPLAQPLPVGPGGLAGRRESGVVVDRPGGRGAGDPPPALLEPGRPGEPDRPRPGRQQALHEGGGAGPGRPVLLPIPRFVPRALLGRAWRLHPLRQPAVYPERLQAAGFRFAYPPWKGRWRRP